ncbi:MAG TPA: hypothetical protein VN239_02540 [Nitrososphaera sp.]|jgi:hypothetical protein|nr:hypothetical protein [Nitrososphaera sp.]
MMMATSAGTILFLFLSERILVHGSMLWVAVLAIVLLREEIDRRAMLKASSSSQHTTP